MRVSATSRLRLHNLQSDAHRTRQQARPTHPIKCRREPNKRYAHTCGQRNLDALHRLPSDEMRVSATSRQRLHSLRATRIESDSKPALRFPPCLGGGVVNTKRGPACPRAAHKRGLHTGSVMPGPSVAGAPTAASSQRSCSAPSCSPLVIRVARQAARLDVLQGQTVCTAGSAVRWSKVPPMTGPGTTARGPGWSPRTDPGEAFDVELQGEELDVVIIAAVRAHRWRRGWPRRCERSRARPRAVPGTASTACRSRS